MPRSKLLVDVDVLADHLPLIRQAAKIVGSADHEGDGTLALIIEGESVPDCPLCKAKCARSTRQQTRGSRSPSSLPDRKHLEPLDLEQKEGGVVSNWSPSGAATAWGQLRKKNFSASEI